MSQDSLQFHGSYEKRVTFKHWWDYLRPIRWRQKKLMEIFLNHHYRKSGRPAFDRAMEEIMHRRQTSIGGKIYYYKDYFPTKGNAKFSPSKIFNIKREWVE